MREACDGFIRDLGQFIVRDMSISSQIRPFFSVAVRPNGYGLKLKSLENILAGDRQFLYDGLILCSTKLLIIYDKPHSRCVTDERQDPNGSTEVGYLL